MDSTASLITSNTSPVADTGLTAVSAGIGEDTRIVPRSAMVLLTRLSLLPCRPGTETCIAGEYDFVGSRKDPPSDVLTESSDLEFDPDNRTNWPTGQMGQPDKWANRTNGPTRQMGQPDN